MKQLLFRGGLMLLIFSFNLFTQWEQCSNGMSPGSVFALLVISNNIYAGSGSGIYVSSNNGSDWEQTALSNRTIYSLTTKSNFIFASSLEDGVWRSLDNGTSWIQTSLNSGSILSLAVNGTDIYAANQSNVYKSADNGDSWNIVYSSQYPTISTLSENGNTIFVGGHGIYLTTNNGSNWLQTINTYPNIVNSMASRGGYVFAGAYGVFRSTNNGSTWSQAGLNNNFVRALCLSSTSTFAGTSNQGVFVSNNNGENWISKSEGLGQTPPIIRCFCISGGYIFAGTWQQNIYRRFLDEFTGVRPMSSGMPGNYSLNQNYPNPFNPSTKIHFTIPPNEEGAGVVSIKIYDILGTEIETLVNEHLSPGSYEVTWDASVYSGGVYYYKLTTNGFTDTKKMILVK